MKMKIFLLIFLSVSLCKSSSDLNDSIEVNNTASKDLDDLDNSKEYFTVTANRLLRLNKPYRVSIQYQGYKNETVLKVGIKNRSFEDFKEVTLFGSDSTTVEFLVSKFLLYFLTYK